MLDKTIPYYELAMRRPADAPLYTADIPAGYRILPYRQGDEAHWARIVTQVGEFDAQRDALGYFAQEFAPHPQELARRCLFAVNPKGERVATLTAWFMEVGGNTLPRVHWVATCPEEQRRGLAKALLARGLAILGELHPGEAVYLTTQTWSHVAMRMYKNAGFSYLEDAVFPGNGNWRSARYILECVQSGDGRVTCEQLLNQPEAEDRLRALPQVDAGVFPPKSEIYVNNHIHTIYSFSPYSPALAVYRARMAGLPTAGIMDHDSVAGAEEFAKAGQALGVATTTGLECRFSLEGTPFYDRRLNNPDQVGNVYLAMHGIPKGSLRMVEDFLLPIRRARAARNRAMVERINGVLSGAGVALDYERDVRSLSQWRGGGSVTERHICYAASKALIARHGIGKPLLDALSGAGVVPGDRIAGYLCDQGNPYLAYDLLGLLKSDLVGSFYLPATEECPPLSAFVELCGRAGAIAAYPYLGDIGESVTGDKKAQAFEDAFLDQLFAYLGDAGFHAVTYMPTRNTDAQLARVQALCKRHGFFQISGEDINSPRQSFVCPALERSDFAHLRRATYALIGHEQMASQAIEMGMFSKRTMGEMPDLEQRIEHFARIGSTNHP